MIHLEWYRTFKTVYELGNLTKASEELFSSQPGVSLHISSLESYIGYKLFERTSRKMIPTERAIILYDYIIDAIKRLEKAEQHFKKTGIKDRITVSIGMCSEVFQTFFEPHIGEFDFDIIAHFGEYPQLLKELNEGILDIVITPEKIENPYLEYTSFFKQKILLVAGSKTDTKNIESLIDTKNWKELEEELKTQIWYSSSNVMGFLKRFWAHNFNKKRYNKPNYLVPNMISILRCISHKNGLALIPSFLCKNQLATGGIKILWEGNKEVEDIFYYAIKKQTKLATEVLQIKTMLAKEINRIN
ncbi:LysR family transcriptional regulator [Aquimarina longa]|uniref:LysR family transcriptional regulator n=1 Tax=Aquimarina longa TaxID=1080221 RepID=UPI000785355D|nr:LysR family transcriptional regulator [Aquimarina longa]